MVALTRRRRALVLAALPIAAALAAAVVAGGAAGQTQLSYTTKQSSAAGDVSVNWAGYVVTGPSTSYTSVTGTWRQPTVTCGAGDAGAASAFWVGLGGYDTSSQTLEQIGTSADCDTSTGRPTYYAWYELVPGPSITIGSFKVTPGDLMTTSVNVLGGTTVELQVKNRTRGTVFTKKLPFANPDLSSAEWIAEAPSSCDGNRCRTIPLSNFGSVAFTKVAALGNGVGGTLTANPGWSTTAITLASAGRRGFFPGPDTFAGNASSTASATPGAVSSDGRGFTVQWTADSTGSRLETN